MIQILMIYSIISTVIVITLSVYLFKGKLGTTETSNEINRSKMMIKEFKRTVRDYKKNKRKLRYMKAQLNDLKKSKTVKSKSKKEKLGTTSEDEDQDNQDQDDIESCPICGYELDEDMDECPKCLEKVKGKLGTT